MTILFIDLNLASHPNYSKFEPLLSAGWIAGRKVDNSDLQYASFRDNVQYMLIVLVLHPALRRAYDYAHHLLKSISSFSTAKNANQSIPRDSHTHESGRIDRRINFDVFFGIFYLVALHGFSAAKAFLILYINFILATRLTKRYVPAATWVFNIGVLFANEFGRGYPFALIADTILPWSDSSGTEPEGSSQASWGTVLDSYGGLIPRWEVLFKFVILRMISFNFDYYWSSNRGGDSPWEVCSSAEAISHGSSSKLIVTRRSSLSRPTSPTEIECQCRPVLKTTRSVTTSHISYMRHYTSQDPF